MSERDYSKNFSNRSLLSRASIEETESMTEREYLELYQKLLQIISTHGVDNYTYNVYDKQLLELEKTQPLQNIIEREKGKARQQEALKKYAESQKEEVQQKKFDKAKSVIASIPLSILGALEVHLIYGLTNFIIALVFWLISYIPVLSTLVEWLFRIRKDTPDMVAMFVATMVAYFVFKMTAEHIIKKVETQKFTLILTGIYLTVFNILFVVINLKYNDPVFGNALLAIAGIVIFFKGKTTRNNKE